jgi:NDP-sugar pyrophosphorylase family protein
MQVLSMRTIKNYESEAAKTQVIMAVGGSGKRMGISYPKSLIKLGDSLLLDRCVNMYLNCGFRKFVFLLGHNDKETTKHIDGSDWEAASVVKSYDYAQGIGRGKALKSAFMDGRIDRSERSMLVFPDDVFTDNSFPMKVLLEHMHAVKAFGALASLVVAKAQRYAYGVVNVDNRGIIKRFEEKPLVPLLTSTGMPIIEPGAYHYIEELIDLDKEGPVDEHPVYQRLAKEGRIYAITIPPDTWVSINTTKELEQAQRLVDTGALPRR